MVVVSRGRLLSKSSFPLIAGTLAGIWADAWPQTKGHGWCPGVEFMDRLYGLAANRFVAPAGCHGQRSRQAAAALQAAADSQKRLNPGVEGGVNPDSHPWADAAHGGPEAR